MASIRISATGKVITQQEEMTQFDDPNRQYAWEQGQIDYLGIDSFDNIQKRIDQAIEGPPPAPSDAPTSSPFNL